MDKKDSNSKYLGLFLIVSSLMTLFIWYRYDFSDQTSPAALNQKSKVITKQEEQSPLQKIWETDIRIMLKEKLFDDEIRSIKKVRLFLLDQNLHSHFKGLKTPFKYKKDGQNLLEVSFMSHHSELDNEDKLIIQYNLLDAATKEMYWEHSRTISLPEGLLSEEAE